ncbi:hypothetical protein [Shewanella psychrotolerans]|uniref:hypothetical protein n=1 Tax=Shewanella psychrotolerans TaxID=2864206 RepID=UPI001C65860A|nr:hypothetical protein [Shewanella psychrotolerans]QYK01081.1 hypothetical protein K0I62_17140 [Shewanella psychrotolerans]
MKALVLAMGVLFSAVSFASSLTQGDHIEAISLTDQNEAVLEVNSDTQVLLFSRGMKGGEIIQEAIESLESPMPSNWRYIADISGMPSLIAKFVAIPKMRDFSFAIGLDQEGEVTQLLPGDKETATVISLDGLKIIKVVQVDSAKALLEAVK